MPWTGGPSGEAGSVLSFSDSGPLPRPARRGYDAHSSWVIGVVFPCPSREGGIMTGEEAGSGTPAAGGWATLMHNQPGVPGQEEEGPGYSTCGPATFQTARLI